MAKVISADEVAQHNTEGSIWIIVHDKVYDVTNFLGEGPFGDLVPHGDPYWYQDFYSPYYNDSHRRVRAAVRKFVEKEIMPHAFEWDEAKKIPQELFIKAGKCGILPAVCGVKVEEFDHFHEFVVCDELARCGSGGVLWGLTGGK